MKNQDPIQGHGKVKSPEAMKAKKEDDVIKSSYNLRNRRTKPDMPQSNGDENEILHHLKFTSIYNPTNRSTVQGKWLFLNLVNQKVLFLGALKTLPWFAIILVFISIVIDVIFKTTLVSQKTRKP